MLKHLTPRPKISFAKKLRSSQTPGEKSLWGKVRAKRFHGFKFRRQVPVGPYIVDFLCVEKNLIIEVDGDSHFQPGAYAKDIVRENFLKSLGFTVIRFANRSAVEQPELVLDSISLELGISKSPLP